MATRFIQIDSQATLVPRVSLPSAPAGIRSGGWSLRWVPKVASSSAPSVLTLLSIDAGAYVDSFRLEQDGSSYQVVVESQGIEALRAGALTWGAKQSAADGGILFEFFGQLGAIQITGAASGNGQLYGLHPWSMGDGEQLLGLMQPGFDCCEGWVSAPSPQFSVPAAVSAVVTGTRVLDYDGRRATAVSGDVSLATNLASPGTMDLGQPVLVERPALSVDSGVEAFVFAGGQGLEASGTTYVQAGDYIDVFVAARFASFANRTLVECHTGTADTGFRLERVSGQMRFVATTPEGELVASMTFGDSDFFVASGSLTSSGVSLTVNELGAFASTANSGLQSDLSAVSVGVAADDTGRFDGPVAKVLVFRNASLTQRLTVLNQLAEWLQSAQQQTPVDIAGAAVKLWVSAVSPTLGTPPDVASVTSLGDVAGYTLTAASAPASPHAVTRATGDALEFDGVDDALRADNMPTPLNAAGDYASLTVAASFDAVSGLRCLAEISNDAVANRGIVLFCIGSTLYARAIASGAGQVDASATITAGMHVCRATLSADGIRLFVDGVEAAFNAAANAGLTNACDTVAVGELGAPGGWRFDGDLYDVALVVNPTTQQDADLDALWMSQRGITP